MELLEDVPHGLRNCHLHAVARIAELEAEAKAVKENSQWLARLTESSRKENEHLRQTLSVYAAKQRWIPVSERLPEDCERVWVRATNSPHNLPRRAFYTYRNGKWVNDEVDIDNVYSNLNVTHWMPFLESPNDTQTSTIVYGKECEG
jgi:hypothetical protein